MVEFYTKKRERGNVYKVMTQIIFEVAISSFAFKNYCCFNNKFRGCINAWECVAASCLDRASAVLLVLIGLGCGQRVLLRGHQKRAHLQGARLLVFRGLWFRWIWRLLDSSHLESLRLLQRIIPAVLLLAFGPIHWSLRDRALFCELPKGILIGSAGEILIIPEHPGPLSIPRYLIGTFGSVCMWPFPRAVWASWTLRLPRCIAWWTLFWSCK